MPDDCIVSIGTYPSLFGVARSELTALFRSFTNTRRYQLRDLDMRDGDWHRDRDVYRSYGWDQVQQWHHDCGSASGWCFVWADRVPTEIKLPNGSIAQGQPCELLAFHNPSVMHRHPSMPKRVRYERNFIVVRFATSWRLTAQRLAALRSKLDEVGHA